MTIKSVTFKLQDKQREITVVWKSTGKGGDIHGRHWPLLYDVRILEDGKSLGTYTSASAPNKKHAEHLYKLAKEDQP